MSKKPRPPTPTAEPEKEGEGTRAFSHFLSQLGDGDCHDELSSELRKLLTKMSNLVNATDAACKGKLALVLSFSADAKGFITATHEVKITEPKRKKSGGIFWVTKNGNATFQNPRQGNLPFTEIEGGRGKASEVDERTGATEA